MTSAAIPRAARISTARGLNSSAISTFGMQRSGRPSIPRQPHPNRRPGESRDPPPAARAYDRWIPAFAGMTGLWIELVRLCAPHLCGELTRRRSAGFGGVLLLLPGPVEPWQQRLDIAPLDGRAGPDADAGRRSAVARQIVAHALGFKTRGHRVYRLEPRLW